MTKAPGPIHEIPGWGTSAAQATPIDERLAALARETVLEIGQRGRTGETALELAFSAMVLADHVLDRFESETPLPQPIVCRPGCDFCCYLQVELTPPEALLLGRRIEENFSRDAKVRLLASLERSWNLKAGKSKQEIARIRRELPCPLLRDRRCSVYPVRPLLCRAMHALDAGQCASASRSQDLAPVDHYAHRREFIIAIAKGLADGCRALGCQCGSLDLTGAILDYFGEPKPAERWIMGEAVFRHLYPLPWEP
jgi:Fe-S-cluster containining protein